MSQNNIFSSTNNYRGAVIAQEAEYLSALRDEALVNTGMYVTIKVPLRENNLDEYNDFVDMEDDDYEIRQTFIEPKFDKYVKTLSLLGQDMERDYPLSISILSNEHMPRNTIIVIQEINSAFEALSREWRVLSTEIKQVGHIYTRIAYAVPARSYASIESDIVEFGFAGEAKVSGYSIVHVPDEQIIIDKVDTVLFTVDAFNTYKSYGLINATTKMKATVFKPQIID